MTLHLLGDVLSESHALGVGVTHLSFVAVENNVYRGAQWLPGATKADSLARHLLARHAGTVSMDTERDISGPASTPTRIFLEGCATTNMGLLTAGRREKVK